MPRKRFTRDEKAQFTAGTRVEWRNGSHWHPAVLKSDVKTSEDGWQYIVLQCLATTRTVSPVNIIHARPTTVRMPAPAVGAVSDFPREYNGETIWACCISRSGPTCRHREGLPAFTELDRIRVASQISETNRTEGTN